MKRAFKKIGLICTVLVFMPVISLCFFNTRLPAQPQQIIFEQCKAIGGWIQCLHQDSRGFIWAGTIDGLFRWDGYTTIIYLPEPGDTTSVSGNSIQCLCEDKEGMLWIGTLADGLNKYNRFTDKFTRFQHDPDNTNSISNNCVRAIYEDRNQNIWIGTAAGLNKLDKKKNQFTCYIQDRGKILSDMDIINAIAEDDSGLLWIGTNGGLYLFDKEKNQFCSFKDYFNASEAFEKRYISLLCPEDSGVFWIGTLNGIFKFYKNSRELHHYPINSDRSHPINSNRIQTMYNTAYFLWIGTADGLYKFDKRRELFTRYEHDPDSGLSLLENNITAILKDKSDCFWFGLYSNGINKKTNFRNYVKYYLPNPFKSRSIENYVNSLFESKSRIIWIGTEPFGLLSFDKKTEAFQNYQHDPQNPNSLSNNNVYYVIEDRQGFLWIGTGDGIDKFDPELKRFIHYKNDPQNNNSLSYNGVSSIIEADDGLLYIGTYFGFNQFDPVSKRFTRYFNDPAKPHSISHNVILTIFEDSDHIIWIGTQGGGLNRFNPKIEQFTRYMKDPSDIHSISSNTVEAIFEFPDSDRSILWIGTEGGGLCRFNKKTGQFSIFTKKDGLPANRVQKIIADPKGNLWLATAENISMFDMAKKKFKNYERSSELPIWPHTCMIDHEGEIFFGGWRGFVRFYPDSMKDNPYIPDVVLTDLKVNYKLAELDTTITEKKYIVLTHKQNYLSFEFAALDFNYPEFNRYAYKMEGADKDWVFTDATRRYATYTNLDPGKYLFKVKGANNDGVWNEEGTSVRIIITPPWWRTAGAYIIYGIVLLSILISAWQLQLRRIRIKHELEMQRLESHKLQEIDSMKSRFFANISHEFRTPLTLILGPLSKMLAQTKSKEKKQELKLMQRNAQRLQRLINQLLDLSKIEAGKMTLQARPENIVALLNRIVQSFESQAKLKKIDLKFHSEQKEIIAYIDRDKIENIFYNLLSNALKFTSAGGLVEVVVETLDQEWVKGRVDEGVSGRPIGITPTLPLTHSLTLLKVGRFIQITIKDTGIGIPPNRVDKIFDRFYQVDDSYTRSHEGTGIGLALTKELVDLHHGKIEVQSELNKGTTFMVYLPLGKEHLMPEEIVTQPSESSESARSDLRLSEGFPEEPSEDSEPSEGFAPASCRKALPLVLIVEDNRDMRSYLQDCLANDYRVIEAVDGEDGWQTAIDKIPDLIISDVMMPKMDGFKLCGRLKSDERTSHIPVILLTARASDESKIKGLEFGADDYLIKPFDMIELQVRARNLIEQRRKLRERFSKDISLPPKEIAVTSYDEKFLQRAMDIIERHLANPDFDVTILTREVGMSRMQLHRKLQALTNQSANKFIRSLRLKKAADLLNQKYGNIAQIAYEVGFSNPAYFAECFRKQFGKLPSECKAKEL